MRTAARAGIGWRTLAWALALSALVTPRATAIGRPDREYAIKAAFLYHFGNYVQWPPEDCPTDKDRFVIGVIGDDPFGPALDAIAEAKAIQGRKVLVRRFASVQACTHCHIVFVARSATATLTDLPEPPWGTHALVVSDVPGMASRGAVVSFFTLANKVRFEVNPAAAKRAGLKISSKLLRLARIVQDERSAVRHEVVP